MMISRMGITCAFLGLVILSLSVPVQGHEGQLLGCGGFVRSSYKLDYGKIEIKLFTKQGSLKMRTECAPTTGYYFIPLEGEGDYILRISPPFGWTFSPSEIEVRVDGQTDPCSKGIDINFDFKGFSVTGNVVTEGFKEGPADVNLKLIDTQNSKFQLQTKTDDKGSFRFDSISPGKYSLSASHPTLSFSKSSYDFEVKDKNVLVENQLSVSGFGVSGKVVSDKSPVQGVTLVLLGLDKLHIPSNCEESVLDGFTVPKTSDPAAPNHILCHKASGKDGIFTFANVKPGKYMIVPIYKGKNIVYNLSPDRLEFELKHQSVQLEKGFEVEGFSVNGKVTNIVGASVIVNGEVRAKSGTNGEFTISKMKPGTYDFEVTAENVQFDKQRITISPNNPGLPEFVPSRYLTCGRVSLKHSSDIPDITLIFIEAATLNTALKKIQTEKVKDPNHTCVFLAKGQYQITLASKPYKSFSPEKLMLDVPSKTPFEFHEFTGFIEGKINCAVEQSQDFIISVQLKNSIGIMIHETNAKCGESYKFSDLEAGQYQIQIIQTQLCWEKEVLELALETSNINNANFNAVGYLLQITSSHSTKAQIYSENEKKQRKMIEEIQLKQNSPQKVCIKESSKNVFYIEPKGCHKFEKESYSFIVGNENDLNLIAKKHTYIGQIRANGKINDLQVKKDEEIINSKEIALKEAKGEYIYEITFMEAPGVAVNFRFFSYGFMLEPNNVQYDTVDYCQLQAFLVEGRKSHVIQGKLTPALDDVEIHVELIGQPESTLVVRSNSKGEYIAGPFIHNRGFNIKPIKQGYTFKPLEKDPYSFNVLQWAKIHVKIIDSSSPTPVSNVLLSLSGPNAFRLNKMSDSNGEMIFTDLQPGEYFLKPLLREFTFEPSALHIELKDQESKVVSLKASRESFSLHGSLISLTGEFLPNLIVTAVGKNNCSEYAEDGLSDEQGNFRIWALKSYCTYQVSVVMKDEFANQVERTIPETLEVKIGKTDTQDVSFVIITPVKRMDISIRVYTNLPKSLDSLRAVVYSATNPDNPIHSVSFNGVSYVILPPIPKDNKDYIIAFESSLTKDYYDYVLPEPINFKANRAYEHYKVNFNLGTKQFEEEIGRSSYFAFAFIILVFLIITYFEYVSTFVKENIIERIVEGASSSMSTRKSKLKGKTQ